MGHSWDTLDPAAETRILGREAHHATLAVTRERQTEAFQRPWDYGTEEPEPRHSRPRRRLFPNGWRDVICASIAAFFLALFLLVLITITHVLGWHL